MDYQIRFENEQQKGCLILTQWDRDVRLSIQGIPPGFSEIEIHWGNKLANEFLVVEPVIDDQIIYVNIPNILLQAPEDIIGYIYINTTTTVYRIDIGMQTRPKPQDVPTDPDVPYYPLGISDIDTSSAKAINSKAILKLLKGGDTGQSLKKKSNKDLDFEWSSDETVDQHYDPKSENAQSGKAVAEAVSVKQDTLISGTNIKTINGQSVLGSGGIEIIIPDDYVILQYGEANAYSKIDNAIKSGKAVFLVYSTENRVFSLAGKSNNNYYFYAWSTGASNVKRYVSVTQNNVWGINSAYFLRITDSGSNKPYTVSTTLNDDNTEIATSKAVKTYVDNQTGLLDLTINGEQYDETKCYFYVETTSGNTRLDLRTIYNATNIKNETSGTCFVSYDGETAIPIVNDDSLKHTFAEAGIHEVAVSGITGLTTNTLFRDSTILKKAVIGNTLTVINHWLFNGVTMDDVLFLATVPPTFSSEAGTSSLSMNNVVTIRVPSQSLEAYRNSAMADSNKTKLAPLNAGIVGEISDIKSEMISMNTDINDTREDLDELTGRFNEYTIPREGNKTYITITLTDSLSIDCRQLYMAGVENPMTTLDWGDGNIIEDVPTAYADNDDNLRHTYAQAGTYTLVISGMTKWNNLWAKANTSIIDELELASTITAIQYSCFENLKKLVIKNPDLFTIVLYNGEVSTYRSIGSVNEIYVPEGTFMNFYDTDRYDTTFKNVLVEPDDNILYKDKTVTVGVNGDYATLSEAMRYLSTYYPTYKYGGIHAYIKILSGTTISEQILVDGADWSWMEIIYEDYSPSNLNYDNVAESIANGTIVFDTTENYNTVLVDATNFTGVTHDTRGDVCLFRAENGGKLPIIGCVFKLTTPQSSNVGVAGVVCNRGSESVIKTLCGFIGFNDGVIANNESSITIREGITMNCARWGCHARHNGEVSARSVIATGCGTVNTQESAALCCDRIADLDAREGYISNSGVQIRCNNTSRMNCNGTHIVGDSSNTVEIACTYVSTANCSDMFIKGIVKLTCAKGSTLLVNDNYTFDTTYSFNTLSAKGVIYN